MRPCAPSSPPRGDFLHQILVVLQAAITGRLEVLPAPTRKHQHWRCCSVPLSIQTTWPQTGPNINQEKPFYVGPDAGFFGKRVRVQDPGIKVGHAIVEGFAAPVSLRCLSSTAPRFEARCAVAAKAATETDLAAWPTMRLPGGSACSCGWERWARFPGNRRLLVHGDVCQEPGDSRGEQDPSFRAAAEGTSPSKGLTSILEVPLCWTAC